MDHKLHLLESFAAQGADGHAYKVRAYERLVRDAAWTTDGGEHWESTGQLEYRLETGERVMPVNAEELQVSGTGLTLKAPGWPGR